MAAHQMTDFLTATAPLLAPAFHLAGSDITWLEIAAAVLGLWMVRCNLRVDPLGWPLAITSSALYALLFVHSKLYGETALQGVFIVLGGWGWWQWLRGTAADGQRLEVRKLTPRQRGGVLGLTLAAWPALGLLLSRVTDSDLPYMDALPTVGSLAGQILLARKWVDNWPVWVAVNAVSLVLFATKGLWLTVALYAVFLGLALVGWRAWTRMLPRGSSPTDTAAPTDAPTDAPTEAPAGAGRG
jgi:nicotinamide mononucleotide transporter